MKKSSGSRENESFIKWNYTILRASLKKIDLNLIWIILLDTLFYLASGYLIIFWFQRISAKIQAFSLPPDISAVSDQAAQRLAGQIADFNLMIKLSFFLLIVAIIFMASIIKGIIWSKSAKAKISLNLISKFLVINLAWMGFWSALLYIIFTAVQPQLVSVFLLIALILASYMTFAVYSRFMLKQDFRDFFASIPLSFRKIRYLLLPYALIIILWFLIILTSSLLKLDKLVYALAAKLYGATGIEYSGLVNSGFSIEFVVLILVSVFANPLLRLVTAFSRYYFSTLVSEMEKR